MKSEHNARIGDNWWLVQFNGDPRKQNAMGLCYNEFQTIRVDDRLDYADVRSTLFHEFAHAACPYLAEDAVAVLEVAMVEALRVAGERRRTLGAQRRAGAIPGKGKAADPSDGT